MALAALVVADDLTGACDAGVQFARRGMATTVLLARDAPPGWAQVVAVSTETRNASEEDAARGVAAVADWITAPVVFKKVDSVLRGSPGAEIRAAMDAFGFGAAVATPAFPAMGRVVKDGWTGGRSCPTVLRSDVHVRPEGVAAALDGGARVVSVDGDCEADLDAIVAGVGSRRVLWAGSGGLAGALATGGDRRPHHCVFCIGSDHEVTVGQVTELRRARPESVVAQPSSVPDCDALVLSGGDTAAHVCREAGARRIDLCDEVLPGIPWGILRCGRFDGIPVVTKSGGFGAPDALIRVAEFFA